MRHIALLFSVFTLLSFNANASMDANQACIKDKSSDTCKAYIAGMVEGYIASKQKYLDRQPNLQGEYATRAFASRVGFNRNNPLKAQPACLPNELDQQQVIAHLKSQSAQQDLTVELGNYLRANYPCATKRK